MIVVYCDGGSRGNPGPAASAFVAFRDEIEIATQKKFIGLATNNEAEYFSLLMAFQWITQNESSEDVIEIVMDSQLVIKQMRGEYKIKSPKLLKFAKKIKEIERGIQGKVVYRHVLRNENIVADGLVNEALDEAVLSIHVAETNN